MTPVLDVSPGGILLNALPLAGFFGDPGKRVSIAAGEVKLYTDSTEFYSRSDYTQPFLQIRPSPSPLGGGIIQVRNKMTLEVERQANIGGTLQPVVSPVAWLTADIGSGSTQYPYLHLNIPFISEGGSGDVNADGVINIVDAEFVRQELYASVLTAGQRARADVNGDNLINLMDAYIIVGMGIFGDSKAEAIRKSNSYWYRWGDTPAYFGPTDDLSLGGAPPPGAPRLYVLEPGSRTVFRVDDQVSDSSPFLIDENGRVGIGTATPQSRLEVQADGYFQAGHYTNGPPSGSDCNADAHRGRLNIDIVNNRLYVCMGAARGWDYTALTN